MSFNYKLRDLQTMIKISLEKLYKYDKYLIAKKPVNLDNINHVSERGLVFRFGIYLEQESLLYPFMRSYNIDAEFNRNLYNIKCLPNSPNGTYPDLIIHKRGSNNSNLLIIEFKTWWNNDVTQDIQKIKEYMHLEGDYKYKYGLSIILEKNSPRCVWVKI